MTGRGRAKGKVNTLKALEPYQEALLEAQRNVSTAERTVAERQAEFHAQIRALVGHDHFEISTVACMAAGFVYHIYVGTSPNTSKGLGHRKCLLCGCDDFDLF